MEQSLADDARNPPSPKFHALWFSPSFFASLTGLVAWGEELDRRLRRLLNVPWAEPGRHVDGYLPLRPGSTYFLHRQRRLVGCWPPRDPVRHFCVRAERAPPRRRYIGTSLCARPPLDLARFARAGGNAQCPRGVIVRLVRMNS